MDYKKLAAAAAVGTGVSYLAYRAVSEDMMKRIFERRDHEIEIDQKYYDWISSSNAVQVKVNSFDGLKLNAYNIHNHDDNRYIIMVHGKGSNRIKLYPRAYEFDQLGYNILLIDQRSAGDSEGEHYSYGVKESQDLQIWINYLLSKYPDAKIALYGLSMGAATIMMATSYGLPENVKCLIEDSGFASLEEILAYSIKKEYKISFTHPVLRMLENKMSERYGMKLSDASPKTCLENNEIPILFVHGEDDEVIPFEHAKILYNHNKGIKKYYPIKVSKHSCANEDPHYFENLNAFLKEYL